jgi:hypothetical protein
MSEDRESLLDKFRGLLNGSKPSIRDPQEDYFGVKLLTSKNKEVFMRKLELDGYRLACDKQHGLAVVHISKPVYSLESIASPGSMGRMKLGDLSGLPSVAEAKTTLNEYMIKALPMHLKFQADSFKKNQSLLLKDIVALRKREQAGDPAARMQRDSLVQWASWQRRDHTLEKIRLKDRIYDHKVDLRLSTMQQARQQGKSHSKGNGLGM